jgi:hypothetical protein
MHCEKEGGGYRRLTADHVACSERHCSRTHDYMAHAGTSAQIAQRTLFTFHAKKKMSRE